MTKMILMNTKTESNEATAIADLTSALDGYAGVAHINHKGCVVTVLASTPGFEEGDDARDLYENRAVIWGACRTAAATLGPIEIYSSDGCLLDQVDAGF